MNGFEKEITKEWKTYLETNKNNLGKYIGKYVLIWNDKIIDSDEVQEELAERAFQTIGYRPLYLPLITNNGFEILEEDE